MTEVAATLWYLVRRYPEAGLLPRYCDIDGEARVISWMSFIASTIHPPGSPHRQRALARGRRTAPWPQRVGPSIAIRSPISTCSGSRNESTVDRYSIADIHLFRLFWRFVHALHPDRGTYPNLHAHYDRMMARPAVQKTLKA